MNKRNLKYFFKQVGMVALAAAFILSTSLVTNGVSGNAFKNVTNSSVVHAASDNIVDFRDEKLQSQGEYTVGITSYNMGVHTDFSNHDAYNDMRVTWKVPEEMAVDLDKPEVVDRIKRYTSITTNYLDEDGETVSPADIDQSPYISINADNRILEYNLSALMDDKNLRLDDSRGTPTGLISVELAAYNETVPKGTYPVLVSVTEGPADPTNVAGAYEFSFEVTEGAEEPEEPEVDKSELEAAIDDAKGYDSEDYTDESFEALTSAVEAGEDVVANEDATQEEVNQAITGIENAVNGLVEVDEGNGDEGLDLEASIEGVVEYDNDNHYYLLDVAVDAANNSIIDVSDVYAGIALPEGVMLVDDEEDTPAEVRQLELEDGSAALAVKLPEMEAGEDVNVTYQIPLLGQTDAVVESSAINLYTIDGNAYQPLGEFDGSIHVDFSNMVESYKFDAKAQIVKDFPDLGDNEFGLRFSFSTQNLTLEAFDQIVVEFDVPGDVTVHSPDGYESGEIPDSLKEFLDEQGLGSSNLDIEWEGNTAIINLGDVPGTQWNQGFFTAFGESTKPLEDLEGLEVLVTLLKDGTEVEEINVPFELVPYEGGEPEPEEPEDPDFEYPKLVDAINKAGNLPINKYTEDSFGTLASAVEDAIAVNNKDDATQDEIDEAINGINEAIDGLVESELQKLINQANSYDSDDYTKESYNALTIAVDEAVEVIENDNAAEEDIETAEESVREAIEGLVEVPKDPKPEPEDPEEDTEDPTEDPKKEPEDDENGKEVVEGDETDDGDKLPKTATSMFNWMLGGLLTMLAGAGVLFTQRRKKSVKSSTK